MPCIRTVTLLAVLTCNLPALHAAISVSLGGSIPSPVPLGTLVTFTATATDTGNPTCWYRFRVAEPGQPLQIIRDFGPVNTLSWTAADHEGTYEIEVTAENKTTGDTAATSIIYAMQSRLTIGQLYATQSSVTVGPPVISPTSHPLVFLYSAPACPTGSQMRVQFQMWAGAARPHHAGAPEVIPASTFYTPYKSCTGATSMNFYLGGMRAHQRYLVKHELVTGTSTLDGPLLTLKTGALPDGLATHSVSIPPPTNSPSPVMLEATLFTPSVAVDLSGHIIWYYAGAISNITRPAPGGYFFGILENTKADQSGQILREFDLTGMTVLETNAARINEQLTALGKRQICAFHHEARTLSNGNIVVLGGVEQILTNVQGPGPVDVLGDMIIILDPNLNVVWTWDTFDHLDTTRLATLNDTCLPATCPPIFLAKTANDWTHGNAVSETADGNLLYSTRSQDWVIKIDYEEGMGTGNILWRLGADGDFTINSTDPSPWFSHQHDPHFEANDPTKVDVFDDGNLRNLRGPSANSRGQVLKVDEPNKTATLILNADLGGFSFALGSAQLLSNGDYHFDVGFLNTGNSYSLEVDRTGKAMYQLHCSAPAYRTFRMASLYSE